MIVGMIPVAYTYFAKFKEKFLYSESAASKIYISSQPTVHPIKSISGNTLFYISPREQGAKPTEDFAMALRLLAVLLLLIYTF